MSDDMTGDGVYQPDPGEDEHDDNGLLDSEDTLVDRGLDDALDEGYSPPDRPLAVNRYEGDESLDERLAEEVPEVEAERGDGVGDTWDTDGEEIDDEVGDVRAGRLVAPGEGSHLETDGLIAYDQGIDGAGASAEEAAVHVVPDGEW